VKDGYVNIYNWALRRCLLIFLEMSGIGCRVEAKLLL